MTSAKITFQTSDKKPENFKDKNGDKLAGLLAKTKPYLQSAGGDILMSSPDETKVYPVSRENGLVGGLISAYNEHHNIVLRPENFWIAVLTQFSQFVNANSEKLRNTFVNFEGKKELVILDVGTLRNAPYDRMTTRMTEQIAANLKDASVREWILPSFSTTTSNDTVVCSAVMMATMQKYFDYKFVLRCGIPSVTLLGTPDDYKNLAARIDRLLEFDVGTNLMVKWHAMLKPIFGELINASQGKHNPEFWSKVCSNHGGGSGPSYISGWVSAFCVFNENGKWQGDNFDLPSRSGKKDKERSAYPLIDADDIPTGLVTVPVKVDDNFVLYQTHMIAGSFALDLVDPTTIQPRLDWCIALDDEEAVKKNVNQLKKRGFDDD